MIDGSRRWAFPGLHYFEDDPVDRALFFGREKEIQQLTERIIAEDLTVLFGKSGDGKTSLINAGLKWAFRDLGYLPVRARIFNLPEEKTPLATLYQAIADEARLNQVALPPDWQRETLWESFLALRPTEENGLKPIVLILDQFEELFTLMAGRWLEQEDFIAQFADLVRGRLPETVREKYRRQLASLPADSDEARKLEQLLYGSTSPTIRILLALREDYLAFLNNLGKRIPKVFASRYRLSSLTIEQARLAIAKPPQQEVLGDLKFWLEDDAIEALLKFLTQQSSRSGLSEEIIGPPQLQVLCRQLEEQMREKGKNSISVSDLGGDAGMRKLLSRYYRGILEKFPAVRLGPGPRRVPGIWGSLRRLQPVHSPRFAVRRLCEERLITAGGNRNSRHEDEIIREIGVAPADLQELVESRLLRREPRLQESFYELSHDSLVPSLQVAGGWRQTWVTGLKGAVIAAIIFIVTKWGLPYLQSVYEMRSLTAELTAVQQGQVDVAYFRMRLTQARNMVPAEKLAVIQKEFDGWRLLKLQFGVLQAPQVEKADSILKILTFEYPFEKDLIATLSDTVFKRQLRQIEQSYYRLVNNDNSSMKFAQADSLINSAYSTFGRNIRLVKLERDFIKRRGNSGASRDVQQLNLEIAVKQESARKELLAAIQIAEPARFVVQGDSAGRASQFEVVLRYHPILRDALIFLNDQQMQSEKITGDFAKKASNLFNLQKGMPVRTGKFRFGTVTIPAGAREVTARITALSNEGVEATKEFTFTVVRFFLRSTPQDSLSEEAVQSMIKKYDFYCRGGWQWSNPNGKGPANNFVSQQNGQVIFDRATGLMWQQSGSAGYIIFELAQKYVEELNRQKFAGYSDWRLPTLEEAMSLMEPAQNRFLYIAVKFDDKQQWIWTSDFYSAGVAWVVDFYYGYCSHYHVTLYGYCVRVVR